MVDQAHVLMVMGGVSAQVLSSWLLYVLLRVVIRRDIGNYVQVHEAQLGEIKTRVAAIQDVIAAVNDLRQTLTELNQILQHKT